LFTSQLSYSAGQEPEFQVDVVSTASKTCTFDIGSGHLWLQISAGKTSVWSSANCAEGEASLVTELYRGVPTVLTIGWKVHASSAGCPVPGAPAGRGTYTAEAKDGLTASNPITFRIT
jgi:hypothetical protein